MSLPSSQTDSTYIESSVHMATTYEDEDQDRDKVEESTNSMMQVLLVAICDSLNEEFDDSGNLSILHSMTALLLINSRSPLVDKL